MMNATASTEKALLRGLAAAALSPGLRSILVLNAAPSTLLDVAATWAALLELTTGRGVEWVRLGGADAEDRLWGRWLPHSQGGHGASSSGQPAAATSVLRWQHGLLGPARHGDVRRIVVIPDLSRLSQAAARACVTLVGAPVAHLERHGRHAAWAPQLCWLAACAGSDLGRVSPHLLDRFALRLDAPPARPPHVAGLRRLLDSPERENAGLVRWGRELWRKVLHRAPALRWLGGGRAALPLALRWRLWRAPGQAVLSEAAARRVLEYFPTSAAPATRSVLALARLTVALARLDGQRAATPEQVDAAAALAFREKPIRLPAPAEAQSEPPAPPAETAPSESASEVAEEQPPIGPSAGGRSAKKEPVEVLAVVSEALPAMPVTVPAPPEPARQDGTAVGHDIGPLRLPPRRFRPDRALGPIVGIRSARSLNDLALVETVLEATKWQAYRQSHGLAEGGQLRVTGLDLREYRRTPPPERLLVLLVDYTCLAGCAWREAVWPYLSEAYTERSSVCLIQVGVAGAGDAARRLLARSLLVPRILRALDDSPGRSTPLAHGLELARQTIRHATEHGRGPAARTLFVLVTDGRGNVPLERDAEGKVPRPVGREGIASALRVAETFRRFSGIESILLDPRPRHYPELPRQLAWALGAMIEGINRHPCTR